MTKSKIIILVIFYLIATAVLAVVGQYMGGKVYFHLGEIPESYLKITSLYENWQLYSDDKQTKKILGIGALVAALITLVPTFFGIFMAIILHEKEEIHGSARWANDVDLQKSGFFPKSDEERKHPSILLGKMPTGRFKGKFVEMTGQTFVGVEAPTGAGKGVGVVIPNLLNYPDSIVNNDIKLENFIKTAGFRQSCGQEVFLFAPDGFALTAEAEERGELRSHRWNPFFYVSRDPRFRVSHVQNITKSIYPKSTGKNGPWSESAAKLFTALGIWMLDTETVTHQTPTIPYLISLTGVDGGLAAWMKQELDQPYLSEDCKKMFNEFLAYPDETRGSVMLSFDAELSVYKDHTVAKALSGNDFDFRDLRKKGISLYVGVRPPNLPNLNKLLNLFFEQLISQNTLVSPEQDPSLTHQCLMLLDEFPALGRIEQIATSIGYTRQYNLRYMLIYQSYSQLEDKDLYGKEGARTITTNLSAEVIYPPKEVTPRVTQISNSIGTKTVKVLTESRTSGSKPTKTRNHTLQKRPLIMPQEIVALGYEKHPIIKDLGTKTLMFRENQRSFIMDKIISPLEPVMAERVEYSKNNIPEIPLL